MKHANDAALDRLDSLLEQIRKQDGLKERKRGVFYRGSTAFLHFHEDPRDSSRISVSKLNWDRLAVNTKTEQRALVAKIKAALHKRT
jgi:hypothetical protein